MSDTNANHDGSSPPPFAERMAAEARAELERLAAAREPLERELAEIAAQERAAHGILRSVSGEPRPVGRPSTRPRSETKSTWRITPKPETVDRVLEALREAPRPINARQLAARPGAPAPNTTSCALDVLLAQGVVRRAGRGPRGNSQLWDLMPEYEHATPEHTDA